MKDKENYKELLGARLKRIHLAETCSEEMPTDEAFLRWEMIANNRRKAQKVEAVPISRCSSEVFGSSYHLKGCDGYSVDGEAECSGKSVVIGNKDKEITSIQFAE